MTTNEIIAKWLGLQGNNRNALWHDSKGNHFILNFLHDRNQQKWIEDELIKKGYDFNYTWNEARELWWIEIEKKCTDIKGKQTLLFQVINQSKDLAFIQAIEQLIDKENAGNKTIDQ